MADTTENIVLKALKKYPNENDYGLARILQREYKIFAKKKFDTVRRFIQNTRYNKNIPPRHKDGLIQNNDLKVSIKNYLTQLREFDDICNKFNQPPKIVKKILKELVKEKFNVNIKDNIVELSGDIKAGGKSKIDLSKFKNKSYKVGVVSDTHLNSKYQRLDVLEALYDIFVKEGITEVYHAGNYVDGEARFNKYDLINVGIKPQLDYFIENYPKREGIKTYFIAGDDHEGWWVQREKINIGEYTQMLAEKAGRNDLIYLSYLEHDVTLKTEKGKAVMRVMHPGGGSSYALSYSPQKMVESFQGGEKPQILILGHFHKADYMYYRDVHVLQAGCTCDQTPFLRKKKIQVAVGGWIIEFEQSIDGAINRFKSEWMTFFNKEYYQSKGYYR